MSSNQNLVRAATATPAASVDTPCVQICIINDQDGLCIGCARTLDEIARWGSISAEARRALMAALPHRRANTKPHSLS